MSELDISNWENAGWNSFNCLFSPLALYFSPLFSFSNSIMAETQVSKLLCRSNSL